MRLHYGWIKIFIFNAMLLLKCLRISSSIVCPSKATQKKEYTSAIYSRIIEKNTAPWRCRVEEVWNNTQINSLKTKARCRVEWTQNEPFCFFFFFSSSRSSNKRLLAYYFFYILIPEREKESYSSDFFLFYTERVIF